MIDSETQNILRDRFNPDNSNLRQYQLHLLAMLKEFDLICRELGLRYWLSCGTLLGAVRHGGFIPWDDDIDVEMPIDDYNKLIKHYKGTRRFIIQTHKNDSMYHIPFAKFRDMDIIINPFDGMDREFKYRGIFIDIFPVEYINHEAAVLSFNFFRFPNRIARSSIARAFRVPIVWLTKQLGFFVVNSCRFLTSKGILKGNEYAIGYGIDGFRWSESKEDIFPLSTIEFEGFKFMAPGNTNAYLTSFYGDYMSLPNLDKVEEMRHIHNFPDCKSHPIVEGESLGGIIK